MNSVTARNQFITDNYDRLHKICCTSAHRVMRRFQTVPFHDLVGYGFEGIVASLDRGEPDSPTFYAYLSKCCYLSALAGALQMLGLSRRPSEDLCSNDNTPREVLLEPSKMDYCLEMSQSHLSDEEHDNLYHYMEIKWFIEMLPPCLEKDILVNFSSHHSVVETALILDIPVRKIRKLALDIAVIYRQAYLGRPFVHLLTPLIEIPKKHIYIISDSSSQSHRRYSISHYLYRIRRKR